MVMLSNIINYGGMFIFAVMITRLLGVTALGEFTYIFAVISIISVIAEFGLSQLLIRKINSDRSNVFSLIKNINIFKFFLAVICVIASVLIFPILPGSNFNLAFAAGIAIIIPKAFQTTYESAIRSLMKQTLPSIIKSLNTFIQIILAYFILIKTGSLFYLFVMMFVLEVLTAIVFKIANHNLWQNSGISLAEKIPYSYLYIKPIIKESFPFFGSNFLTLSIPRVILIILGNLSSQASLGIFSAASRFANGVGLISGALYNTIYPAMTNPGTPPEVRYRLAKKFTAYSFLTGLIISLTIFFTAGILIDLTFKIPEAVPVLKLLGFTVIPILTYSVIQPFLYSAHREKFILKTYLAVWIINIPLSILLIHLHNYTGAAFSSLISEYLLLISFFVKFRKGK